MLLLDQNERYLQHHRQRISPTRVAAAGVSHLPFFLSSRQLLDFNLANLFHVDEERKLRLMLRRFFPATKVLFFVIFSFFAVVVVVELDAQRRLLNAHV